MKQAIRSLVANALLVAGVALSPAAQADFELTGPEGRRILLKDDGTWRYVQAKDQDQAEGKAKGEGEAVLLLERKMERGSSCGFALRLVNNLPYEIGSLVPYYSAYRANGVIYDTVASGSSFTALRPGNQQSREIEFTGITCKDIARVQVVGGDRCEMGDLNKFSEGKGRCLARIRVAESELVRFDK